MSGPPHLLPAPSTVMAKGRPVTLADGLRVAYPRELAGVARWFRRVLETGTAWYVSLVSVDEVQDAGGSGCEVVLLLAPTENAAGSTGDEGYRLVAGGDRVTISANTPAGVFYGLQTLRQLLPPSTLRKAASRPHEPVVIEGIEVVDEPRLAWRGVHLDVARHFMAKDFVLKMIDLASFHKLNVFHLHLTDDQGWRIPISAYPRLTEVGAFREGSPARHWSEPWRCDDAPHGGFYSREDLAEIVAYAAERHVTVLPEIDMPGHMVAAIASYPELGDVKTRLGVSTTWGISEHVLNLEEATLDFCKEVLDETTGIFPGTYVHIGGDECPTAEWEESERARQLMADEKMASTRQLQGWFTQKMAEHLAARGRRVVAWGEVLEAGAPEGTVIVSWQDEKAGIEAAARGYDVVMAAEEWLYFDWASSDDPSEPLSIRRATSLEKVYGYDPVPSAIPPGARHHVLGAQCQLWTEYVPTPERAEYMYFPRLSAFSEVAWTQLGEGRNRSFEEFEPRLRSHLRRLDALGVNYRPLEGPSRGQAGSWQTD